MDLIELDIPSCLGIVRWHENLPGSGEDRQRPRSSEDQRDGDSQGGRLGEWGVGGEAVGGALPIEHRQSPMVPRLSAQHRVGAVLRYLTPSCGGLYLPLMGAERCTGALVNSSFVSSFCLNPKYSKIHLHVPQTGMNARQMLQMLPRYRSLGGGPESCFDCESSPYIKKPGNTKSGRLWDTKNKNTVKTRRRNAKVGGLRMCY